MKQSSVTVGDSLRIFSAPTIKDLNAVISTFLKEKPRRVRHLQIMLIPQMRDLGYPRPTVNLESQRTAKAGADQMESGLFAYMIYVDVVQHIGVDND